MDTIFYLFNVNLHFIAMQTSGANAITLHIVQKEQCTPNVFSATHSTLLVVAPPLEDRRLPENDLVYRARVAKEGRIPYL